MSKLDFYSKLLHGTDRVFDAFKNNPTSNKWSNPSGGIFLTDKPEVAHTFATQNRGVIELDPLDINAQNAETIGEFLGKDPESLTPKDAHDFIKLYAKEKGGSPYYLNKDGLLKKYDDGADEEALLRYFRKGYEPRILDVDVAGKQFDLTDPKNAIEAIGDPKTRASQVIKQIASEYKTDPSGYNYQMRGNYTLPPQATDLADNLQKQGYTNIKMPDDYVSGGQSTYVYNPEKNAMIKKITPLGAGVAAPSIDPLDTMADLYGAYKKAKGVAVDSLMRQTDISPKSSYGKQESKQVVNAVADPINLIPGAAGLGASFMDYFLDKEKN